MQRLRVSSNNRFLVTEDGQPFFWLGDTAWELFHRCDRDEAELYLENRRQKGYNVVQAVALAELDGLRLPNPYGHLPLIDLDPLHPNEAYFEHVDWVIDRAAEKGIYIALLPTWGDKVNQGGGKGPQIFTPANAYHYGKWIAGRYRSRDNIVWVNGGDRMEIENDVDTGPVWRSLAEGIVAGWDRSPLITYHPRGERTSSWAFHNDSWLSFNMLQSGHMERDLPAGAWIAADYERTPTKPILNGEPNYEDLPVSFNGKAPYGYFDTYDVRKAAYWSVFAGGFGHTYGHNAVWQMHRAGEDGVIGPLPYTWREALDRPAAGQMQHLKHLMLSRPFLTRIPDQSLIASDVGEAGLHLRATRDSEGRYAMIYTPTAQPFRVNTWALKGSRLEAWWYDPRTGSAAAIGHLTKAPFLTFQPPADGPDWVLVLDDRAAQYPAPGTPKEAAP